MTDTEFREQERILMDFLVIARSCKGEGRRDLQELLPVHRDLVAFFKEHTAQEAERHADAVIGEDVINPADYRWTSRESINEEHRRQRNRNHYQGRGE